MDNVTLSELRTFSAVARLGNLTAAATELAISPGAISRRLNALEERLETRLLNRSTRAVSLTATGEAYLARILPALETIEVAGNDLRDMQQGPQGKLRLSLPVNFGRLHIAPHLADFLARYPALSLDAQFDDRFVDLVGEGLDLAIRIGRLDDSRLVARRIAADRRIVVASPGYLAQYSRPRHPTDLRHHECLHYTNFRGSAVWSFRRGDTRLDIPVRGRLQSNYGLPLVHAAEAGLGLLQTATSIVGDALAAGRLVTVLDEWRLPEIGINAVYPGRKHVPAKVRAFIEYVETRLGTTLGKHHDSP